MQMNKIIDIKNYIIFKLKNTAIRKSWFNAALRDSIIAALTVLAISCTTGYIVYVKASADLKKETQNNLLNIARSASEFLDGDAHQKITKPEDFGSSFYEGVRAPFFSLLRANSNIKFIYTVIKLKDKYYFILDSSIPKPGEVYNPSKVMTEYTEASETLKRAIEEQAYKVEQEPYTDEYGTFLSSYVPIYNSKKEFLGVVGADISIKDFLESTARLKRSLLLGTLIGTLASIIIGFAIWLMRQKAMTAEKINKEQHSQMLLMQQDRIKAEQLQKTTSENKRQMELNQIATDFEQTVQKVVELVVASSEQLRDDAEKVANIAKDAKKRSSEVADNSLKTAQISEEVSLSASELTSSINKISEQTSKSSQTAYEATTRAKSAKEILESLSIKSTNIGKIVSVINGITRQINLLALNATIESARAGESGKGFAIVAHEIKALAEQVKGATNEISKQILTVQDATHQSVDSVMNIITSIEEASENAYIVASAVEEQSAVTNKIAKNITITANGAKNISSNIALVENGADEVGQTANKLLNSAINLDEQAALLKEQINKFITNVRNL